MSCCCENNNPTAGPPSRSSTPPARSKGIMDRAIELLRWALPVTLLALIPKCPACVAAYVLLFTGVGLSFTAAVALRWTLIAFCIAPLAYLLVCTARRLFAIRRVT